LGGAVMLTAIKPDALWSGEPTATATPAPVSPVAAELYRKVFKLDRAQYVPVEYKHLAIQFRRSGRRRCWCRGSGRFAGPDSVRLDRRQRHRCAEGFRKLPTTNHLQGYVQL